MFSLFPAALVTTLLPQNDQILLFLSNFSCKWQTKATTQPRPSVGTLHPPPRTYLHPHPHLQSQSSDHQPCVRPALLSRGANLHYGDELSNCVDSTAGLLQQRAGLSLDMGIMQWPGFRGHFPHCLRSISRNASLVDSLPPRSAEGPLTAPPNISVQSLMLGQKLCFKMFQQIYLPTSTNMWCLAPRYTNEFSSWTFHLLDLENSDKTIYGLTLLLLSRRFAFRINQLGTTAREATSTSSGRAAPSKLHNIQMPSHFQPDQDNGSIENTPDS